MIALQQRLSLTAIFYMLKSAKGGKLIMKNKYLTEIERYQIEALYRKGHTVKDIAVSLGRCKATIYNELKRGMTTLIDTHLKEYQTYCADVAQEKAVYNATAKGRHLKIGNDYTFVEYVKDMLLNEKYSPYAILQKIKETGLHFQTSICKNTLYNYIRMGLFDGVSMQSLPCPRKKKMEYVTRRKVALNNTFCHSIEERDKSILKRDEYGHWEMDTVVSGRKGKGVLLVLTERMTRQEQIHKINSKSQEDVVNCLNLIENKIGSEDFKKYYKTITCDNGTEFLDSVGIVSSINSSEKRTDLFYCHPFCSSERGSNENANRLIRRWIPKGSDISRYSDEYIKQVQDWLNNYPRKIFNGLSSNQYRKLYSL